MSELETTPAEHLHVTTPFVGLPVGERLSVAPGYCASDRVFIRPALYVTGDSYLDVACKARDAGIGAVMVLPV